MVSDNMDEMVELLREISRNTGTPTNEVSKDIDYNGVGPDQRVGFMDANSYVTVESANEDHANDDGSVTVEPGETVPLVSYREGPFALAAVGATDAQDVSYALKRDDSRVVGGVTNSPLGILNRPFSFVENFGGVIPIETNVVYEAHLDESAGGPVDLAARLHVEQL